MLMEVTKPDLPAGGFRGYTHKLIASMVRLKTDEGAHYMTFCEINDRFDVPKWYMFDPSTNRDSVPFGIDITTSPQIFQALQKIYKANALEDIYYVYELNRRYRPV